MIARRGTQRWSRYSYQAGPYWFARALALGLFLIGASIGWAREARPLTGRVVDRSGRVAAGARVWVTGGRWDKPQTLAETTTDGQGRFHLPALWGENRQPGSGSESLYYVYVFAVGHDGRVGWRGPVFRNSMESAVLSLHDVADVRGRLSDQAGKPIAGAEILPLGLSEMPADNRQQNQAVFSPEMAKRFRAESGADGTFVVKGLPLDTEITARVAARGFGEPWVTWNASRAVRITLDGRLGRIKGQLKAPDARGLTGDITLTLRTKTEPRNESLPQGGFRSFVVQTVQVGRNGDFGFNDLPPGQYTIRPEFGSGVPLAAKSDESSIKVDPGAEVTGVEIPLQRLLTITGRVVDETTGEGIAGVTLTSYQLERQQSLQYVGQSRTDAQGRYIIIARPSTMLIQPADAPETHLGLRTEDVPRLEVKADQVWPDLKLTRATGLDGIVVNVAGKPIPGARVFLVRPGAGGYGDDPIILAEPDGTFHLSRLDPSDTLPVRARTPEATTDGAIVIRPRDQQKQGRLTLKVDPAYAFKVKGRVADRAGRPVSGAKLMLWWNRSYVSEKLRHQGMGIGSVLETYTTDSSGEFTSRALWPGDLYKVAVEANGYSKAESPPVSGNSGQVHDFGTITLIDASGHITGRVVDSGGKPLAEVAVFNHGDGPKPALTRTDATGQFRLEGLYPGTKHVFARKDGFRFTGVKIEQDAAGPTIRLLRTDEPPPAWKPGATAPYEEQRAFARSALTQIWERFSKGPDIGRSGAFVCILDMAQIDPALALKWSAEHGHRYDGRVRQTAGEALADTDAKEALELLAQDPARDTQNTLQQLAERFSETDREKSLLFAEEAAVQARALEQPDRARAMAQAGTVLTKLGRSAAGRKLIDEATDTARRLGTEGMQGYTRAAVAQAVAPFDTKLALELIEPLKEPNDKDRYAGFVATGVAAADPVRAVALADAMAGNSSAPEDVKTEVAYRIGGDRPEVAIKIIEGMKGYSADKARAEAFAWLAVAVAHHDRPRAFALIDRALSYPLDHPEAFQSWVYFGAGTASAALIAANARRIGYPDMESVVMRVLASRPTGRGAFDDPAMQTQSATIAASILALTDPGSARELLRQIELQSGFSPADLSKVAGRHWLQAWALADLKHAEALFQAELAALTVQNDQKLNLQMTGLFKMVEVLAVPPHRRESYLLEEIGAHWHPGKRN